MSLFFRPGPDLIDPSTLTAPQPGERIIGASEIALYIATDYNAEQLSADSTQAERHAAFTRALRKVIDAGVLIPRARIADGRLCLVATDSTEDPSGGQDATV